MGQFFNFCPLVPVCAASVSTHGACVCMRPLGTASEYLKIYYSVTDEINERAARSPKHLSCAV